MKNPDEACDSLERRRHRGDVAITIGALLSVFAILAAAALAAWSLSADDERYATVVTTQNVPLTY
ncbi:MAG TPA: hypothetical protein VHB68_18210 [Steroidobacteraceae bacterium]|nr:hypothetical protein [Steroidobacteraceae bacterium]